MRATSEIYNETYNKSTNLAHLFDNLEGNIHVLFLLLTIPPFYLRQNSIFLNDQKVPKLFDDGGRFRNVTGGPWFFFLRENILFTFNMYALFERYFFCVFKSLPVALGS